MKLRPLVSYLLNVDIGPSFCPRHGITHPLDPRFCLRELLSEFIQVVWKCYRQPFASNDEFLKLLQVRSVRQSVRSVGAPPFDVLRQRLQSTTLFEFYAKRIHITLDVHQLCTPMR